MECLIAMKLALYRKYRSTKLDDVIGQDHITTPLKNAIKQGKIQHAYLFNGSHGIGKTSVARIFAHEINNFTYDDTTKLDIIEIDGASNRKIDEIRNLREKIHIAPSTGRYKVYIIDEVHMLTKEAFNALLKTLEEPPAHAVFILATTEPHKLPSTIISRTQRYTFKKASEPDIATLIDSVATKEKIVIDDDAKNEIAKHSNNSFRDSLSILDQLSNYSEKITIEHVQDMLGLVSIDYLARLHNAVKNSEVAELKTALDEMYQVGTTPRGCASQLAQYILENHPQDVALAQKLLTVRSYENQEAGLLVTLLQSMEIDVPHASSKTKTVQLTSASSKTKDAANTDTDEYPQSEAKKMTAKDSQKSSSQTDLNTVDEANTPSESAKSEKTIEQADQNSHTNDTWAAILAEAKQQKMKVHPILRLAKPQLENDKLTGILVQFPLHKKKLEESHCQRELSELLQKHFNVSEIMNVTVNKARETKPMEETITVTEAAKEPETETKYDSIKEIMGGGETVTL